MFNESDVLPEVLESSAGDVERIEFVCAFVRVAYPLIATSVARIIRRIEVQG